MVSSAVAWEYLVPHNLLPMMTRQGFMMVAQNTLGFNVFKYFPIEPPPDAILVADYHRNPFTYLHSVSTTKPANSGGFWGSPPDATQTKPTVVGCPRPARCPTPRDFETEHLKLERQSAERWPRCSGQWSVFFNWKRESNLWYSLIHV